LEDELGAGVAPDDASELAAALGFLELVGQAGKGGEPDAPALVARATASAVASIVLPVPESPMKMMLSRSSIQAPSASAAIVA
jgi:hypothetical protein